MSKIKNILISIFSIPSLFYGVFVTAFPLILAAFGLRILIIDGLPQRIVTFVLLLCSAVLFLITNGKGMIHIITVLSLSVVYIAASYNFIIGLVCFAFTFILLLFEKTKFIKVCGIVIVAVLFLIVSLLHGATFLLNGNDLICSASYDSPDATKVVNESKYFHGNGDDCLVMISVRSKNETDLFLLKVIGEERDVLDYWCRGTSEAMPEIEWVSENEIRVIGEVFSLNSRSKEVRYSEDYQIIRMD